MKKLFIIAALFISFSSFATPTNNNRKIQDFYNKQGELVGATSQMNFDKLPKDAIQEITTKYTFPAYNLKDCIMYTDVYGETNFFVSMSSSKEKLILAINEEGQVSVVSKIKK
jgi:hypothetical protein